MGSTEWLELVGGMPKKNRKRVYAEIGSTFAIQIARGGDEPRTSSVSSSRCSGRRNILWGTDSIWWGSPQWLIDAFSCLTIPERCRSSSVTRRSPRRPSAASLGSTPPGSTA